MIIGAKGGAFQVDAAQGGQVENAPRAGPLPRLESLAFPFQRPLSLILISRPVLFSVIDTGKVLHHVSGNQAKSQAFFQLLGLLHLLAASFYCK